MPFAPPNLTAALPAAAPEVVTALLRRCVEAGASDLHLHRDGSGGEVRFRLDGVLGPPEPLPPEIVERIFGRVKYLARLSTWQEQTPQDGRMDRAATGLPHDVRVATYPTATGELMVLRLVALPTAIELASLGLPAGVRRELERALARTDGLLLLTGPAGSGKTTTIYACLRELTTVRPRHVITIEDPVEQVLSGLTQTEIREAAGLTYARAARHLLRHDPEVLVIGEVRDDETAQVAMRAALTGHLVISTLHAGSCRGVFERLVSLTRDTGALASTAVTVVNQRLFRRLCGRCRGEGCAGCLASGYRGRVPAAEVFTPGEEDRARLRAGRLDELAPAEPLAAAARALVGEGATDHAEFRRVLGHEP